MSDPGSCISFWQDTIKLCLNDELNAYTLRTGDMITITMDWAVRPKEQVSIPYSWFLVNRQQLEIAEKLAQGSHSFTVTLVTLFRSSTMSKEEEGKIWQKSRR